MQMTSEQVQAQVAVAILRVSGDIDGSNYRDVIGRAQELYQEGSRYLLIDLGNVPFMSSSGLVALHQIALLFGGKEPPNVENGWQALRAVGFAKEGGMQGRVRLLNPGPSVAEILEQTGLLSFFPVHDNQAAALAAFS